MTNLDKIPITIAKVDDGWAIWESEYPEEGCIGYSSNLEEAIDEVKNNQTYFIEHICL